MAMTHEERIRKVEDTFAYALPRGVHVLSDALFLVARSEIMDNEDTFRDFVQTWYGNEPGFFWRVWREIPEQDKTAYVLGHSSLRDLLLVPARHVVELGILNVGTEDRGELFARISELLEYFKVLRSSAPDNESTQLLKVLWQGRGGILSDVNESWFKASTPGFKKVVGQEFQKLKSGIETNLAETINYWRERVQVELAARDAVDLSLPGIERAVGTRHLIRQTYEELQRIFLSIGFSIVEGPEIETPYYNFEALNIPEHHPARDNMDTFYIEGSRAGHLLRTHTSPMQIRTMEKQKPPVRIVVPGKVYRRDNPDSTHGYMFHQIEGLAVDTDITFCDFKGTVEYFVREFLGPKAKTRLRPSYFPFTEPSAEVDATCHVCGGSGCRVCKFSGWIELFGAGMVNPAVYGFVGYDAERLSGFAFGMGIDRLAMMKYGVSELPLLFQNDVRFLSQFP